MPEFKFLYSANGYNISKPIADERYDDFYYFCLSEETDDVRYEVIISKVPSDSILIKLDEDRFDVSGIFNSQDESVYEGICKKADYILIDRVNNQVSFIELKLGKSSTKKEITYQLIGAECIFRYLCSLISKFCTDRNFERMAPFYNYNFNYIAICNIKVIKKQRYHKHNKIVSASDFIQIDYAQKIPYKFLQL